MAVYVLDKQGHPLMPCSEKRARLLLERGRARVHRQMPFVIRLTDRLQSESQTQPLSIKIDPGSKFTGIAVVRQQHKQVFVLSLIELVHRGAMIKKALLQRAGYRRRRRSQNLRYRAPRFNNRTRKAGWLAPSLQHRVDTTMSWVTRLRRWAPVTDLVVERVKFDMQLMQNPEISGVEYQQGALQGYEVREYLLEKWGRKCMYCNTPNVPLQIEHILARANGGSNRSSNLGLACDPCNQRKGKLLIDVFLKKKPELLKLILAKTKTTLRDAAAVNATRNSLFEMLLMTGLPVEAGTGGQTKFNRRTYSVPKTHALDAVCVGELEGVHGWEKPILSIKAMGRGDYQRTRICASGFPRGYLTCQKRHFGFQTGDMVKATVTTGKKIGEYQGRVAVRATGRFNIQLLIGVVQGIGHRNCVLVQRADGYSYHQQPKDSMSQMEEAGARSRFA
jgi:5-methylcytosine-specific restriction endonuclease McrA